jgi:N-methylhydantoinase A/oxoprolinase/acetone carboxylase beta subunit/N-methylhydantoinase B/oxoprolinase/acetone carboxylase alpha subunit
VTRERARLRAGIDTGGTFTDLVLLDEGTGALTVAKRPSSPADPARAVFDTFAAVGVAPADLVSMVIGTTIATNAMIERRGAEVVYVTSAGFEDIPTIGRIDKEDPYDLDRVKPESLVRRDRCLGVRERLAWDGAVVEPLSEPGLEQLALEVGACLARIPDDRDAAIAVNLLFAFANEEHEERLARFLRDRFPAVPLSVSHRVSPIWREYERGSTTIADAFLKPVVQRFIDNLRRGLSAWSFPGTLSIMKSNGGQTLAPAAGEQPVQTVLSGLTGGIVAGRAFGALAGESSVITLDMGGTSADIGLVREGEIAYVNEFELEFGLPIAVPAIDIVTIGAGGGSIAWVDDGSLLRVGPRSAGAIPGPACYGAGGTAPTVTDANLILGRLDPGYFLGGELSLDLAAAERAVGELAAELGLDLTVCAQAIVEIANESMAAAIRRVAIDRGRDPRDFELVAFGGAGPLHAAEIAHALGIPGVIVPPHPGLASAYGTLVANRRIDRRWTHYFRSDAVDLAAVNSRLDGMAADVTAALVREGQKAAPTLLRSISMRYVGQNYERDVSLPAGPLDVRALATVLVRFHEHHDAVFGYSFPEEPIELIHFNVTALGAGHAPSLPLLADGPPPPPRARRPVHVRGLGLVEAAIYRRERLPANCEVTGPAIVEEPDSTTFVPPGHVLRVSPEGLLRITSAAAKAPTLRERELDAVAMSIVGEQLVSIATEMGVHMMRSAYSPIFSESRDFSCALFDRSGRMIAQGPFNPAHLGAIPETVRCVLEELGGDSFEPGDVVVHNDPFRGGCHLPEHMLLAPVFHRKELIAYAATIGHLAEVGAVAVGSFASTATEVFQEGLRLPPVKLVRAGKQMDDIWKIILSNHRTPRNTWGDLHAMIGSLRLAERRLGELLDKVGRECSLAIWGELIEHAERLMRRRIAEIPDGCYRFEDEMEDDGITDAPVRLRAAVTIDGDSAIVDYTGTDRQARGPVNATYGVASSATFNAFLQISGSEMPRNAGAYRCLRTIAPEGTAVNVRFPGPSVGGNTETQPRLVGLLLGALAPALPERVMAAEGATSCNFVFGGVDPRTGERYAHYHFEASGWGGRMAADGQSAQNHIHGNCRNTPIEVFETRFPLRVASYGLIPDSGGPGRHRGGLGVRRVLRVLAPELTASAMMDRVQRGAWGLFGGEQGRCASIMVRRWGDEAFRTFSDAFGTVSPSKFANVTLHAGDEVLIESAGGGGFGRPSERDPELVRRDVELGLVSHAAARHRYSS